MSETNPTSSQSDTDIALHLRAAQQQLQAIKSQPGTNVDLTGVEQSINAALDLHNRQTLQAGEADYTATTGGAPEAQPTADELADRGLDQPAATSTPETPGQPAEAASAPVDANEAAQQAAAPAPDAEQVPDTSGQVAPEGQPVDNPPTA